MSRHVLSAIVLTLVLPQVLSRGYFQIRITDYLNSLGQLENKSCCAGNQDSSGLCSGECNTFFRLCLKQYASKPDTDSECTFGRLITPLIDRFAIGYPVDDSRGKTLEFEFDFAWPGSFSLVIEAWHDTTGHGPSEGSPRSLILRNAMRGASLLPGQRWTQEIYREDGIGGRRLQYAYRVVCDTYSYGDTCSTTCKSRDDPFGHYTCSANGTRVCNDGYGGDYCDTVVCAHGCHPDHGSCSKPGECKCKIGYQGARCDVCMPHPRCGNGYCNEPWECKCRDGWGGNFCDVDLNRCTTMLQSQQNPCGEGQCLNEGPDGFTCRCPSHLTGQRCEIRVMNCDQSPCENGATCMEQETGFKCRCPVGFFGDRCNLLVPPTCQSHPCRNGATCVESNQNYECVCAPGYYGRDCSREIDECATKPCKNGAKCIDELNGYQCMCAAGYMGAQCEVIINDCADAPCDNGATCVTRPNGFECRCPTGFAGARCQINIDDCLFNQCKNGGTCHDLANDFVCSCPDGWVGKDCSINQDECSSQPCMHSGTCEDRIGGYQCHCPIGFTGRNCQNTMKNCLSMPCLNQATCEETEESYRCICRPGFYGRNCEVDATGYNGPIDSAVLQARPTPQHPVLAAQPYQQSENLITMRQILIIVCICLGVPLLVVCAIIVYLVCRRPASKQQQPTFSVEQEQNWANQLVNNRHSMLTNGQHAVGSVGQQRVAVGDIKLRIVNETERYDKLGEKINNVEKHTLEKNCNVEAAACPTASRNVNDLRTADTKSLDYEKTTVLPPSLTQQTSRRRDSLLSSSTASSRYPMPASIYSIDLPQSKSISDSIATQLSTDTTCTDVVFATQV